MKRVLFNIQRIFHTTDDEMNAIESVMQNRLLEKNEFLL